MTLQTLAPPPFLPPNAITAAPSYKGTALQHRVLLNSNYGTGTCNKEG